MVNYDNLEEHLRKDHGKSTLSDYLRQVVYGANDGIVTTFAVVAGFTGASTGDVGTFSLVSVLLFGLANLFADATSMGLGNYLSVRSAQKHYQKQKEKETEEIRENPKEEREQAIKFLSGRGFSEIDAQKLTDIYIKNEDYFVDFMMREELKMADMDEENPVIGALITFFSFASFGFVPIIPYFIILDVKTAFLFSCALSVVAMLILSVLRWRITKEKLLATILEVLLVGCISGLVAFFVGSFFG